MIPFFPQIEKKKEEFEPLPLYIEESFPLNKPEEKLEKEDEDKIIILQF